MFTLNILFTQKFSYDTPSQSRVSECQQRVHDLIDLQLCSQGVTTAIRDEDFEKGAAHIHRFLSMDQNLLQRTADDVAGSITSVSQAVNTLEKATTEMRQIIQQKFDDAVKKDDLASVERFFKIFPLLGMYDEGIQKFSAYICSMVSTYSCFYTKPQKNLFFLLCIAFSQSTKRATKFNGCCKSRKTFNRCICRYANEFI